MADISGGPPICEGWVCGILGGSYGPAVPSLMICADLKLEELETLECSWWHTRYGLERLEQGRQTVEIKDASVLIQPPQERQRVKAIMMKKAKEETPRQCCPREM